MNPHFLIIMTDFGYTWNRTLCLIYLILLFFKSKIYLQPCPLRLAGLHQCRVLWADLQSSFPCELCRCLQSSNGVAFAPVQLAVLLDLRMEGRTCEFTCWWMMAFSSASMADRFWGDPRSSSRTKFSRSREAFALGQGWGLPEAPKWKPPSSKGGRNPHFSSSNEII